jgi:FMN phosphatase YigB (HAD superfamily)
MRIAPLVDFFGISAIVGNRETRSKNLSTRPQRVGHRPERTVHIGNRLDTDVLPAQGLGMRTAWILRGEANPSPSDADLKTPDIVLTSLNGVPEAIASL